YGGTPGTATAFTAYAGTHTASTLTGRERRHSSAAPPISAAAIPRAWLVTPASTSAVRAGLPERSPASCSAVTSTTSSTFPARAQRRRGAGWLTAAPVSHRQRTSHEAFQACRGPACRGTPDCLIPQYGGGLGAPAAPALPSGPPARPEFCRFPGLHRA